MFSKIKVRKHIEQNFHSVAGIMPQGWDLRMLGVKNLSVRICDDAPSTACSSYTYRHLSLSLFSSSFSFFFLSLFQLLSVQGLPLLSLVSCVSTSHDCPLLCFLQNNKDDTKHCRPKKCLFTTLFFGDTL